MSVWNIVDFEVVPSGEMCLDFWGFFFFYDGCAAVAAALAVALQRVRV